MEKDKYSSLGDSYIEIEGDEKEVSQFINATLNGETKMELSTKTITQNSCKINKKESEKKFEKKTFSF